MLQDVCSRQSFPFASHAAIKGFKEGPLKLGNSEVGGAQDQLVGDRDLDLYPLALWQSAMASWKTTGVS